MNRLRVLGPKWGLGSIYHDREFTLEVVGITSVSVEFPKRTVNSRLRLLWWLLVIRKLMCCFELYKIDVVRYRNARFGWHFSRLAAVLSCCRFRKNLTRAHQHGPCCLTRAPVLIHCVAKKCVFQTHFNTGRVDLHGHPCWSPVMIKKCVFWAHFNTGSVDLHGHPCWCCCVDFLNFVFCALSWVLLSCF